VNFLDRLSKIAVTALITLAIVNLLIGVFLRYFVGGITNYMDWNPVPFTWVEEVGEMALAWLTLVGAAIGIRSRSHFTLHVLTPRMSAAQQRGIEIFNHLMIAGLGLLAAFYGVNLCRINWTLKTPGLEISMALLYASSVVGGLLIAVYAISMIIAPPPPDPDALH
jgi:TRAP-type C4-dicarboxylate transport system permease small subunit